VAHGRHHMACGPVRGLLNHTSNVGNDTNRILNTSCFGGVGDSGAEVATMDTYYGVQSLSDPGRLPTEIAQWQLVVPNSRLSKVRGWCRGNVQLYL
jgi:hypothetical protein